jgi:uncharacterized protein
MIIDGHRHIVGDYAPILQSMDALGVDKTVLVGVGVRNLDLVTIHDSLLFRSHLLFRTLGMLKARQLVNSRAFRENLLGDPRNEDALRAVRERPDRFYGFAFINPESPHALAELRRCLAQGFRGIKLALVQYPTDLRGRNMTLLSEVARECRIPVFMHLGISATAAEPDWLAEAFADVTFIIAHAGVQRFEQTIALARRLDNVYVDTSSYIATTGKLRRLCKTIGAGKLIFGSDVPVMCEEVGDALAKIVALNLPASEKDKILGGNLDAILAQTDHLTLSSPS